MTVSESTEPAFAAPPKIVTCNGLLFDMDGTIIDSTEAVEKHWGKIGKEIGVDPAVILATSHGRRSIDVLKIYEPRLANWDYISRAEAQIPLEFGQDAVEIPGARKVLDELEVHSVPWSIVTSGTRPLVTGWLDIMKLAHPKNLVTAEDVQNGKPDPSGYQMGMKKLGLRHQEPSFIVFEDAPAGIRAGKAAGCMVVALNTSHSLDQLREAGADIIVRDMRSVEFKAWDKAEGEVQLLISNALM
ncbi:HAD-like protein [Periconia macrospinosa]|uniref:HAD-like protein n=1 Tax=Periconia macrospinosa TaxID=97972 RepID=A0A2V1DXM4_9PLEO|nr:HAD-like protein [Periconia macrospinosa]